MDRQFNTWKGLTAAVALAVALAIPAQAQQVAVTAGEFTKVGLSGGQFLKIGVGARGSAMAGAYSGVADDATSVFWNPAGLVEVDGWGANFSHTFWFAGMSHSFAAAVIPISEKFRLAASFTGFNSGDITITTTNEQAGVGGIYNVADIAIGFTLAGYLTEQFSFGATAKFVNHGFTNMSASGFVFDIGTRYNTGFNGVTLGFSINSLGTQQSYTGSDIGRTNPPYNGLDQSPIDMSMLTSTFEVPLSFKAGLGVDMFKGFIADAPETDIDGTVIHSWIMAADFETFADVPEQFAIGTEYAFREFIALRAGYRFGSDQFGLAGGVGLKYRSGTFDGRVDYSVNPTESLGLVQRISLEVAFD